MRSITLPSRGCSKRFGWYRTKTAPVQKAEILLLSAIGFYYAEDKIVLISHQDGRQHESAAAVGLWKITTWMKSIFYIMLTETEDESLFTLTLHQMDDTGAEATGNSVYRRCCNVAVGRRLPVLSVGKGQRLDWKKVCIASIWTVRELKW